ncbi:MAG: hypothetical protein CTY15_10945 [Methylocystis sp.]|nr:MAG: hypothetical protein CTY15_10945 [Methylocystis sp.]
MYFALGFLVAGLITLLFLPAFWRRALRLSMRRLQMLAPMSMEEVIAERDLLRADFAVRERRLEQEMEAVRASKAHDLSALGRHAARIAEIERQLKQAAAANRDMELQLREAQKMLAERTDLLSSTESALHEMTERADRDVEQLRLLESDKEVLGREKEAQYSRVVAHEAKIGALHDESAKLQRELDALNEKFERAAAEAARVPGLIQDYNQTFEKLQRALEETRDLTGARDETRAALAAEESRRRNEVDHLENALRNARAEARDAADKLEAARADNAMLNGAVEALRAERANQRRASIADAATAAPSETDVAALREAIVEFGDRVAQLAESGKAPERAESAG